MLVMYGEPPLKFTVIPPFSVHFSIRCCLDGFCVFKIFFNLAAKRSDCCTEAADKRNALGSRTKAFFLTAAEQKSRVYASLLVRNNAPTPFGAYIL